MFFFNMRDCNTRYCFFSNMRYRYWGKSQNVSWGKFLENQKAASFFEVMYMRLIRSLLPVCGDLLVSVCKSNSLTKGVGTNYFFKFTITIYLASGSSIQPFFFLSKRFRTRNRTCPRRLRVDCDCVKSFRRIISWENIKKWLIKRYVY